MFSDPMSPLHANVQTGQNRSFQERKQITSRFSGGLGKTLERTALFQYNEVSYPELIP